jgi:hypothetical protein
MVAVSHDVATSTSWDWSYALVRSLVQSLGDGDEVIPGERNDFVEQIRRDAAMRSMLARRWRNAHEDLVEAVEVVRWVEPDPAAQCDRLLSRFSARDVLLELLTYEHDDGRQLAEDFVAHCGRPELAAALAELLADDADSAGLASAGPSLRIVIFGGHPRDESKMSQRLADEPRFELRWKPCDASQGAPDSRALTETILSADGVLIVTTMVSHNVMNVVKRFAQKHAVPWTCIEKATEARLRLALAEMFPLPPAERSIN